MRTARRPVPPAAGEVWRECPRCRHPMTRRALLARHPERLWVVWDPDRWWLPVPWEGAMLLAVLGLMVPGVPLLLGRRSLGVIILAGFVWAVVSAWLTLWWRRRRRRRRTGRERGDDWVCAACLHTEARS